MPRSTNAETITYRIRVQGSLDQQTASGMCLIIDTQTESDAPPTTTLIGTLPDEAALDDLLDKLYAFGLPLISVEREEADADAPAEMPG